MKPIPEIFVNQMGCIIGMPKTAVMPFEAAEFTVEDMSGNEVYRGRTSHFGYDEASGDDVYIADFSDFNESGRYRICAEGKKSCAFEIGRDIYNSVCCDTLHAFYYLRCGCGLDRDFAGEFEHAPCHTEDAVLWEDNSVKREVCGGWHDAGDYGRYVTAGAAALAHMLYGYKMFPDAFDKLKTNIPDSCETPDLLTECRIELEWIMKMQREDGGVYHKLTTKGHAGFVMPEDDRGQLYLLPVSSSATADAAAVCALASGIYRRYDNDFADRLYGCALKAYEWLEKNPDFLFDNPRECTTGGYGERNDRDNRFWAAAELYALTGEGKYHDKVKMLIKEDFRKTALGYSDTGGFGALAYILAQHEDKDLQIENELLTAFEKSAESLAEKSRQCGYGTALEPKEYAWGSSLGILTGAMIMIIAAELCGRKDFEKYALLQMDYILGKNALGISYISGAGEYSINYPHYRPSSADDVDRCHEGFVSGGANYYLSDEFAKQLIPKGTPAMKCFVDDERCYSLNEITIYWNSPAVFVSGYFSQR